MMVQFEDAIKVACDCFSKDGNAHLEYLFVNVEK